MPGVGEPVEGAFLVTLTDVFVVLGIAYELSTERDVFLCFIAVEIGLVRDVSVESLY